MSLALKQEILTLSFDPVLALCDLVKTMFMLVRNYRANVVVWAGCSSKSEEGPGLGVTEVSDWSE